MKRPMITLLALTLSALSLFSQSKKRALLVGVGVYSSDAYASRPLNAVKGVQLMRATLLDQGFSDSDMAVLTDVDATREGIRKAFEQYLQVAGEGDICVFYFYGHGTQIQDDNNDETDKLDEALVPHDGRKSSEKEHHNLIRDDELGRWVENLRRRTGPAGQVLVLLDACHSGSGLRGAGGAGAKPDKHQMATPQDAVDLAPFVTFYSSMPHQSSMEMPVEENERCALLTWAFCKAMQHIGPATTYRGLFEETTVYVASRSRKQTPQLEGAQDRLIFGGEVPQPNPYFKAVTTLGAREMLLAGGVMHGLHAGARVVLYPPETRDTAGAIPLAFGTVPEAGAGLLECTVTLDRLLPEAQLLSAWVFLTQRRFIGYTLAIRLDMADAVQENTIRNYLADMTALTFDAGDGSELTLSQDRGKLVLWSADGVRVWEERYASNQPEPVLKSLREALGNYLQAQFLRGLEFEGSPYSAEFTAQVGVIQQETSTGRSSLTLRLEKDTVFLKVVNRSAKPIYYTIIDIDARNVVEVLLPGNGRLPADFRLEPGAGSPLHGVRFHTPGREVLKLIATPVPVDLRNTVASRGRSRRGGSFFENLFAETYLETGKSRGPSGAYQGNEAGVETVVLEVVR